MAYCQHSRSQPIVTHADCVCNEVRALKGRHQVACPDPKPSAIGRLRAIVHRLALSGVERWPGQRVVDGYSAGKKRAFQQALDSITVEPLQKRDATIRMFLKDDKYTIERATAKAPRCIQYRSKRYCVELGRYLKPIEHEAYRMLDVDGTYAIAKAANSWDRARVLRQKWQSFAQPYALLLDHSNFDAHCSSSLLRVEHEYYLQCYPGRSDHRYLSRMLAWQLKNRGYTKNGTKYYTPGTRMSGDMNTALGNSILNYSMLRDYLDQAGVRGSIYVDGDDSVVIIDRRQLCKLPGVEWFLQYGMETKLEFADSFSQIEFCQTRPVNINGRWRMTRNWERALSRDLWTTKVRDRRAWPSMLSSIGMCNLACSQGVPILQAFAVAIMARGNGKLLRTIDEYYRAKLERPVWNKLQPEVISDRTRQSFEHAWGVSPEQQKELESIILDEWDYTRSLEQYLSDC